MKLTIDNFAKISHAEFLLDGITVIAGDNNTGKSTAGKVLYSIFRSLSNIDQRIVRERIRTIRNTLSTVPGPDASDEECERVLNRSANIEQLLLERARWWCEKFSLPNTSDSAARSMVGNVLSEVSRRIDDIVAAPVDSVGSTILLRVFDCVFHGQFHPLRPCDGVATISYSIREGGRLVENWIRFLHDHVEVRAPTQLMKTVRLISDPNALNLLNIRDFASHPEYARLFDKFVYELGEELSKPDRRTAVESSLNQDALRTVFDHLQSIIADSVRPDERKDYVLREPGNAEPTKVENLSMGLKSFALVKTILERQVLSSRDVLILDEPEIHLHPEWQVVYAKAIVLLQQAYDLTVLLTSHSSIFINAIQRFASEADLADKTNFYLSHEDPARAGFYTFDRMMSSNTGPIFRGFNRSREMMERLSDYPEQRIDLGEHGAHR